MADHADVAAGFSPDDPDSADEPLSGGVDDAGLFTIGDLEDEHDAKDEEEFGNEDHPLSAPAESPSRARPIRLRPKPPPQPRPNTIPVVMPYRTSRSVGGAHGSSRPVHLSDGIECHTRVEFDDSPGGLGAVEATITECPRDLEEGETLRVDLGDGRILVTQAPFGGVDAGEAFTAPYRIYDKEDSSSPGSRPSPRPARLHQPRRDIHWNAGLCGCCDHGPCHPSFLGAVVPCCSCFLLSQVMTRLNLNSCGCRCGAPSRSRSTFEALFLKFTIYYIVRIGIFYVAWGRGADKNASEGEWGSNSGSVEGSGLVSSTDLRNVGFAVDGAFWFYVLCLLARSRVAIRERYLIPGSKILDFFLSALMFPCVLSQAARQTADYTSNTARWCTDTGLEDRHDAEYGLEDPVVPLQPLRTMSIDDRDIV